jgi:sterol-4alpha-carboxylate 3-dehydrogenase (decarboxylating)
LFSEEFLHRVNVGGTQNVVNAACKAGVARFVFISSASVVYEGKDILDGREEDLPYATGDLGRESFRPSLSNS